ncbi:MAG: DUF2281 domain-containing protein [Pyrinomonadaceae bacterium]|nr:DUF2281 domain-containing protein [Pyrinomonadaceae bacterium]
MDVAVEKDWIQMFRELEPKAQAIVVDLVKILHTKEKNQVETKPTKKRIAGLHQGQGWISDDFNDELGDEFWFGEDFGIIKKDDESAA